MARRAVGRVEQVLVYPVRSMAGRSLPSARIADGGLAGDRIRAVVDASGEPVRAKDAPVLATLPADADDEALSAALGRPVHLDARPPSPGTAAVHLVSRQAVERAAAGDVPEGCSAEDPRANLLLDLAGDGARDGAEAEDERSWVGRTVQVGTAVLEVTRTPRHCLGVYAEVRQPGTVSVGDAVLL